MKRFIPALAAAAVCASLTLTLWMDRTGGELSHALDLAGSLGLVLITVAIGWTAAGLVTRDADRRGIVALIAGLWAIAFGTFQVSAAAFLHPVLQRTGVAIVVWTLICAAAVFVVLRSRVSLAFLSRVLAIAAVFLLGSDLLHAARAARRSDPTPTVARSSSAAGLPSVYVIVLDKYSSGAWLSHSYGVDHLPFEDSLRALGFVVPRHARANYAHTQISLASFLNWRYVDDSASGAGLNWQAMTEQISGARVWEAFRAHGYRTVSFPSTFPATRELHGADVQLPTPTLHPSRRPMTFLTNSPFGWLQDVCARPPCARDQPAATPYPVEGLADIQWKLSALVTLAESGDPVFAFVHLLVPHEPYLFARDCSARDPWWPQTDQGPMYEMVGSAYADQVRCLTPLLLRTVRALIEKSAVPPVIVLQSDHGHGRIAVNPLRGFTITAGEANEGSIGERLAVFAAYRFPGADSLVHDDVSAVNVFPLLFAGVYGDSLQTQPDRSYWSSYQKAFEFVEVPAAVTRPPAVTTSR